MIYKGMFDDNGVARVWSANPLQIKLEKAAMLGRLSVLLEYREIVNDMEIKLKDDEPLLVVNGIYQLAFDKNYTLLIMSMGEAILREFPVGINDNEIATGVCFVIE